MVKETIESVAMRSNKEKETLGTQIRSKTESLIRAKISQKKESLHRVNPINEIKANKKSLLSLKKGVNDVNSNRPKEMKSSLIGLSEDDHVKKGARLKMPPQDLLEELKKDSMKKSQATTKSMPHIQEALVASVETGSLKATKTASKTSKSASASASASVAVKAALHHGKEKDLNTASIAAYPSLQDLAGAEKAVYKDVSTSAYHDMEVLASRIAVEVTFALADQVEELAVCNSEFRMGLHRVARWTLTTLFRRTERCVVVPDAIPGYTMMAFKKPSGLSITTKPTTSSSTETLDQDSVEARATARIIESFLGKANHQILVIEASDVLMTLFPVPDLRKNLKDLGFYITD